MCVIIDTSLASKVFAEHRGSDYFPLWKWIEDKDGVIVYGGHLQTELYKISRAKRYLKTLSAAGKAHRMPKDEVDREEKKICEMSRKSDDPHVLALARLSGARVLCSNDRDLHDDFKNLSLVPSPRGRIYQKAQHAKVLKHTRGCIGRPR